MTEVVCSIIMMNILNFACIFFNYSFILISCGRILVIQSIFCKINVSLTVDTKLLSVCMILFMRSLTHLHRI